MKHEELELQRAPEGGAIALRTDNPIAAMLEAVVKGGVTSENVAAIEKLTELWWKTQERDAEREFNEAFVALQKEMPVIVAQTVIPNRGKYERFEDIMNVISPLLTKHGFSVSFSNDFNENRILETCHLSHIGGHSRKNSFAVRVGGKSDSETQADCKAATTAKRNALLNALNVIIRQDFLQDEDNDPRNLGETISREQAEELERRVKETNSDVFAFLKLADAPKFSEIMSGKYEMLDAMLRKKEARGR
jgi:hypothetical protein